MALKLSTYNDYKLTDVRISDESILVGHRRALDFLQEFGTEDLRISTVLYENSIWLHKFLIPQENVVLITVPDGAIKPSVLSFNNFDDLVHRKSIIVLVSSV